MDNSLKMTFQENSRCVQFIRQSNDTVKGLRSLLERQELVDITITCGWQSLKVHKCVLAAHSSYFDQIFRKNPSIKEVSYPGCSFEALENIIQILYFGQSTVLAKNYENLRVLAQLFKLTELEKMFTSTRDCVEGPVGQKVVLCPAKVYLVIPPAKDGGGMIRLTLLHNPNKPAQNSNGNVVPKPESG